MAVASGVLREPGARQKKSMPLRTSSSTMRSAQSRFMFGALAIKSQNLDEIADLVFDLVVLRLRNGSRHDPGT